MWGAGSCQIQFLWRLRRYRVPVSSNCRVGKVELNPRHGTPVRISVHCLKSHLQRITCEIKQRRNRERKRLEEVLFHCHVSLHSLSCNSHIVKFSTLSGTSAHKRFSVVCRSENHNLHKWMQVQVQKLSIINISKPQPKHLTIRSMVSFLKRHIIIQLVSLTAKLQQQHYRHYYYLLRSVKH